MDKCTFDAKMARQECARKCETRTWSCEEKKLQGYAACSASLVKRRTICENRGNTVKWICLGGRFATHGLCKAWHWSRYAASISWVRLRHVSKVIRIEAKRFICYLGQLCCRVSYVQQEMPTPRPGKNSVTNLTDGPHVIIPLMQDLKNASSTIHLSMLLFFNDKAGNAIADALIERAQNNVEVRVLFNFMATKTVHLPEFGLAEDANAIAEKMRAGGVAVIDSHTDYDRIIALSGPTLKYKKEFKAVSCSTRADVDNADHRKLILIDSDIGYCGSANIGDEYLYTKPFTPSEDSHEWHDGLARFQGPVVGVMEEIFKSRWVLDGEEDYEIRFPDYPGDSIDTSMQVYTATPGFKNSIRKLYVQQIRKATSSIFIENPYLFHPIIIEELISARQRRPELAVTLIVPNAKKTAIHTARTPRNIATRACWRQGSRFTNTRTTSIT